ncbi:MAG TPA: hypothetical protein VGD59_15640 [Acidisarcina sp.]
MNVDEHHDRERIYRPANPAVPAGTGSAEAEPSLPVQLRALQEENRRLLVLVGELLVKNQELRKSAAPRV